MYGVFFFSNLVLTQLTFSETHNRTHVFHLGKKHLGSMLSLYVCIYILKKKYIYLYIYSLLHASVHGICRQPELCLQGQCRYIMLGLGNALNDKLFSKSPRRLEIDIVLVCQVCTLTWIVHGESSERDLMESPRRIIE